MMGMRASIPRLPGVAIATVFQHGPEVNSIIQEKTCIVSLTTKTKSFCFDLKYQFENEWPPPNVLFGRRSSSFLFCTLLTISLCRDLAAAAAPTSRARAIPRKVEHIISLVVKLEHFIKQLNTLMFS
jgi:hypothetical protein